MNLRRILAPAGLFAAAAAAGWLVSPSDVQVIQPGPTLGISGSGFVTPTVTVETPRNWRRLVGAVPDGERLTVTSAPALSPDAERVAAGASTAGVEVSADGVAGPGRVTGQSWELAAALAALDAATPGSLTGDLTIAATGTVAADGTVGPVTGIDTKLASAAAAGAAMLLAPGGNSTTSGPTLEVVETVSDAVAALCALGADDALCAQEVTDDRS